MRRHLPPIKRHIRLLETSNPPVTSRKRKNPSQHRSRRDSIQKYKTHPRLHTRPPGIQANLQPRHVMPEYEHHLAGDPRTVHFLQLLVQIGDVPQQEIVGDEEGRFQELVHRGIGSQHGGGRDGEG